MKYLTTQMSIQPNPQNQSERGPERGCLFGRSLGFGLAQCAGAMLGISGLASGLIGCESSSKVLTTQDTLSMQTSIAHSSLQNVSCAAETDRIILADDSADDPAVWVHPHDPALSLVIGTNKKAGLEVYDLAGKRLQTLPIGRPNNVDIVQAQNGSAIVVASNRTANTIDFFVVDPTTRALSQVNGASVATGLDEVYGLCAFMDADDVQITGNGPLSAFHVVVGSKSGLVRIYQMTRTESVQSGASSSGANWSHALVREFAVGGQAEGMVADVFHGWLYVGEEQVGVWQYPLDPTREPSRRLLDAVASKDALLGGGLAPDVEGIALYDEGAGKGWLIVSCQGEDRFQVYDRATLKVAGSFQLTWTDTKGTTDRVTHTDGITALSTPLASPLGHAFPRGIFVAQDDNDGANQNFKIVDWSVIQSILPYHSSN